MSFPLAGNEKIKAAVVNSLAENRLPHAIIIEGDIGTGRHTLARFLAKASVCSEEKRPCGVCKNCHLEDINSHPDITVISPEEGKKNISVEQIRKLKTETFIKPHMAKRRVFIIDFADTMNEQSQNALLKVLEEPPGNIVFILIVETKASLLETIISRCVLLGLSVPEISVGIAFIKENFEYSQSEAEKALKETGANIGKALDLLSGKGDTKTSAAAKEFIGCMLRNDEYSCIKVLTPFEKKRVETDRFFKDLKYQTANMLKANISSVNAKGLAKFYGGLSDFEKSLNTNVNLPLLFSALTAFGAKIFK